MSENQGSQTTSPAVRRDLPLWVLAASTLPATVDQAALASQHIVVRPPAFTNLGSETANFNTWINAPVLPSFNDPILNIIKPVDNLGTAAKRILGDHACDRLSSFLSYPPGWAGGKGKTVSTYSLGLLESFLLERIVFDTEPSLFFTREGFLQLSWESKNGHKIEIEFRGDRIEYFLEKNNSEGSLPSTNEGLQALVNLMH